MDPPNGGSTLCDTQCVNILGGVCGVDILWVWLQDICGVEMKAELETWNIPQHLIEDCCWVRYTADNSIHCAAKDPTADKPETKREMNWQWKCISNAKENPGGVVRKYP